MSRQSKTSPTWIGTGDRMDCETLHVWEWWDVLSDQDRFTILLGIGLGTLLRQPVQVAHLSEQTYFRLPVDVQAHVIQLYSEQLREQN